MTAHYDTPPKDGKSIDIKNFLNKYKTSSRIFQKHEVKTGIINKAFYFLLQNMGYFLIFFVLIGFIYLKVNSSVILKFLYLFFGYCALFILFILISRCNKDNDYSMNDNSLGVIMALQLYKEHIDSAAVILFDNEEHGLVGSSLMKRKINRLNKPVINFDVICLGDTLIYNYSKKFEQNTANIDKINSILKNEGGIKIDYEVNQDHINFSNYLWISYATVVKKRNKIFIKKGPIHTEKDNEFLIDIFNDYRVLLLSILKIIQ